MMGEPVDNASLEGDHAIKIELMSSMSSCPDDTSCLYEGGKMLRFILVRGVLAWGLGTALIVTAIQGFQHHRVETLDVARNLATFMAAGVFWGVGMWWYGSRKRRGSRHDS
jgi:hypothetical protein